MGQIIGFNYASIENQKLRRQAQDHACEIRKLLVGTSASIVEIGRRLIELHQALGSSYSAFIKAEFDWSQPSASKFEAVAREFGDLDCLDRFQPSALQVLVNRKTDKRATKEAIRRARSGEVITLEGVRRIIRKHLPKDRQFAGSAPGLGGPLYRFTSSLRLLIAESTKAERKRLGEELLEVAIALRSGSDVVDVAFAGLLVSHEKAADAAKTARLAHEPAAV